MISLKDFWQIAKAEVQQKRAVMLCLIVSKQGSAPRGVGAHMLVLADGTTVDTIGGGILEYKTKIQAQQNLQTKTSALLDFSLSNNEVVSSGMICGGLLRVLMQYLSEDNLPQIDKAIELLKLNKETIISIDWQNPQNKFCFAVYDMQDDFPLKTKLQDSGEKSYLQLTENNKSNSGYYCELIKQRPVVYLFGGGYVSQELAKLLPALEFEYVLIEEREEFAKEELFPEAKQRIVCSYDECMERIQLKASDFAIVLTSGHQSDTLLLHKLLQIKPAYIGAIGSKRKKAIIGKYLQEQGFSQDEINSIALPIGLPIQAITPAEIAISIVAQLISERAK